MIAMFVALVDAIHVRKLRAGFPTSFFHLLR
jgi:hypothetical protein